MLKGISDFYNIIMQLAKGRRLLDNRQKYMSLCISTAFVHLIFSICMGLIDLKPLCYYNIFVVLFYLFLGLVLAPKENFRLVFVLTFLEIELHSTLATVLLGWDWGFMLYTIALVPGGFYLANTFSNKKRQLGYAIAGALFVIICYFAVRIPTNSMEPVYEVRSYANMQTGLEYFNTVIAFSLQFVFSALFALEVRYMEKILEDENVELEREANYDPLTKLLNRRSMTKIMEAEIKLADENDGQFCIVMADIDNFKRVNDTYGHDAGDVVLKDVAAIIVEELREGDFVCRWGGEEILMLIHGDKDDVMTAAWRVCRRIEEHSFEPENVEPFHVTITMGVSVYQTGVPLRTLISEADEMLYYGKNHGKNQVVI